MVWVLVSILAGIYDPERHLFQFPQGKEWSRPSDFSCCLHNFQVSFYCIHHKNVKILFLIKIVVSACWISGILVFIVENVYYCCMYSWSY
jgi:hypothetical protein